MTTEERDPTPDEIARVGRYWAKVKALTCQHESGITISGVDGEATCPDCDRPLRFLSDIQIEELRKGKQ